ncbi:MAG: alpha/beta hydrolase [bacterium]|nr:alpha/beta hydrolase [bacterium]
MKKKRLKLRHYIELIVLVVVIIAGAGFAKWVGNSYQPNEQAVEACSGNDKVVVTQNDYIEFMPTETPTKGFIFYPGGLVEPEAYAPLCMKIAEQGYLVVIAPMTCNLAILSPDKAEDIQQKYEYIKTWAIGGHSLGGVMASKYASTHKSISGVVLYASYPQSDELKDIDIKVLSLYGSLDGVAKLSKVKEATLSKDSKLQEITGGNHSYFGSYGLQEGDHEASITSEEQQKQAAESTIEFLSTLN